MLISTRPLSTLMGRVLMAKHCWVIGWIAFLFGAVAFTLLIRITLYIRNGSAMTGVNGLVITAATFVTMVLWNAAAVRCTGRALVGVSFLPMLVTLPVTIGVLTSDGFARQYYHERDVMLMLLVGLPLLSLTLQLFTWAWEHYDLSWRKGAPILIILLTGFGLRAVGMCWGLPFAFQPEETYIYFRLAIAHSLSDQWNPHYFQNPSLWAYLLGGEFRALFAVAELLRFGDYPGALYMLFREEQGFFYAIGRLNSVLLGTGTAFVVYLIGRRLWSERTGLLAAAMLAVNFLHVRNSQYAVNDVPSAFLLVLSFYFAVRVFEKGQWKDYLLAGLIAGLAASTKYNAGMVVVSLAVAHWVHHHEIRQRVTASALGKATMSALAALGGFVMGTPYSVLDVEGFRQGFLEQLVMGNAPWSGQASNPTAEQLLASVLHGAGLPVAALALVGVVILFAHDRSRGWLVVSFVVPYVVFMSSMDLFFVRWVVPVMPFVALLGAFGLDSVLNKLHLGSRVPVVAGIVLLVLMQPIFYSVRLDWLLLQQDTRQEANSWAEHNLPGGSKVAIEAFSLLDQESLVARSTLNQLDVHLVWRATMHDLRFYREEGFDYLAISSFLYDRAFVQPDKYSDRIAFYEQLEQECQPLATFTPRKDERTPTFALDDLDTPFWHLLEYDRPGPTVRVYALRR